MLAPLRILLFAAGAYGWLHHFFVGTTDGTALYSLELDDELRSVGIIQARDAAGASSSLVLDSSKKYLFTSRPDNGTITRYSVGGAFELKNEGTTQVPASCNTTKFSSLHLTSGTQAPNPIYGSASTGTCSTLFSVSVTGFHTLKSKEIAGDIRSLAWSPNGQHLHALDSKSSSSSATSIFNFHIEEDPNLETLDATDILANVSSASQIISHPTGSRFYLVTKDTNELVSVSLPQNTKTDVAQATSRFKILPSSLNNAQFTTSSLAISSSNTSLWTLSQSTSQAVITLWSLNSTTGEVIDAVTRATWKGAGAGMLSPAPFAGSDLIAVTNSPSGYVAFLGAAEAPALASQGGVVDIDGDDFLEEIVMMKNVQEGQALKIKSFGRIDIDLIGLGEGVWID